jgi:hypothetical protein|tara:strand:- start:809 stop:1165 length:357 start_codon:yes stop_codon:yes gene_type:complete
MTQTKDAKEVQTYWTLKEKENLPSRYSTELLVENCNESESRNPQFPLDAYIVTYKDSNGDTRKDIVRASAKVNLFDMYYDKFGADSLIAMDYGHGTVNPKLYGLKAPSKPKKNRRRNA